MEKASAKGGAERSERKEEQFHERPFTRERFIWGLRQGESISLEVQFFSDYIGYDENTCLVWWKAVGWFCRESIAEISFRQKEKLEWAEGDQTED